MRSGTVLIRVMLIAAGLSVLIGCGDNRYEVALDFLEEIPSANISSPAPHDVKVRSISIGDETRESIQAPGKTDISYSVLIPQKARLEFGCAAAPHCWNKEGDGVLFEIVVSTGADREVIVHSRYIDAKTNPEARKWFDETVSLTAFEGQRVTISLSNKPGPADDPRFDAAVWSHPRLLGLAR
jgi:hypothetical protein